MPLRGIEMDNLTNRSRTFAEAVATMVWLVVLAAALSGMSQMAGLSVPNNTLILAGSTIITGICPLLACCLFQNKPAISDVTAILSAAMLFSLAYWVAELTISIEHVLETVTGLSLCCMVVPRIISYCIEINEQGHPERSQDFHTVLDGSHEFLCSMTGFHFLWLESLALEGLSSKSQGMQHALSETMGIINIVCFAGGLFIMHIGMTPLVTWTKMDDIPGPFDGPDSIMIITICIVLVLAMWKLVVLQALILVLLIVGPSIAGLVYVRHISCPKEAGASKNTEPPKLAPLGLTKLMVTGFLTVSISVDPTDRLIKWFLVFAAAAIVSGLIWRLLTQAQLRKTLENNEKKPVSQPRTDALALVAFSANTACFCAHTFVAIATVLLMFKTYNVD